MTVLTANLIIIQMKANLWFTGVIIRNPVLRYGLLEVVRVHVDPERRDGGADGVGYRRLRPRGGGGAGEDLPTVSVNTVRVTALAHATSLGDLDEVLEPGVERHHRVVRDEGSAAVLVVLGHAPVPRLAPVVRLETHLELVCEPTDAAVSLLPPHTG